MKPSNSNKKMPTFTEDEADYLKELLNIGHGYSASLLADLLEEFVTLSVPGIHFYTKEKFVSILEKYLNSKNSCTIQAFWGDICGETFFIIDETSMINLRKVFEKDEVEDDDIMLELINIMNASLVSSIANELGTDVTFDMPSLKVKESIPTLINPIKKEYSQAIVLTSTLNFQNINVAIKMLILIHDDSILWMHNTIKNKIIELLEWS